MTMVHEMTRMFRQVLDSMSRPGEIKSVEGITHHTSLFDTTYLLAQTLLDNEVTCALFSKNDKDNDEFKMILNTRLVDTDEADYIVIGLDMITEQYVDALKLSKVGNFVDPQQSATWIIEVEGFDGVETYELSGPGIEHVNTLHIDGMNEIFKVRNELCSEFPLGVDIVFVSRDHLVSIPRTTVIKEVN